MRAALLVAFLPGLFAQPAATRDPWSGLRAKNPPGGEFSLRLKAPHPYSRGELIPLEASIPAATFDPAQGPPSEQWQFRGFLLDPAGDCGTLQQPCFAIGNGIQFNGLSFNGLYDPIRGEGPRSVLLNTYVPPLRPGHYHAAMLLQKLVLTARGPQGTTSGYAEPPQYAVTNAIEFESIPASRAWTQQTVASAIATLKTTGPQTDEARGTASQQLRFLGSSDAWRSASDLLPLDETILSEGLAAANQPEWVCELLQSRIARPDTSVSRRYFSTMLQVCTTLHVPPPPAPAAATHPLAARITATPPPVPLAVSEPSPELRAYFEASRAYRDALVKSSTAILFASLSQKQPEPLAEAFDTLLDQIQQARNALPPQAAPEWAAGLANQFQRLSGRIDARRHYQLLSFFVSTLPSPELIPALESVMDGWKQGDYYEAPQTALASLYRIDPARARARILSELVKPATWLDVASLKYLPAGSVPPMDDALIEALARAQRPGGWNAQPILAAIAKYGTPEAAPKVKAIYESQQQPCQPELLAYFVRVDPAYADGVFHSHPWDMQIDPPRCTLQYFERTAPLAMSPGLERYMAAYLMHSNVFVKTTAAHTLALYGTKAATGPLWDAFRYFHDYWKDKPAELPPSGGGVQLEVGLRNALARSPHWLANESDLRLMESLCISGQCRADAEQDLQAWSAPLRLELSGAGSDVHATVAQYYGLDSVEAIEEKLAQFPRGTTFVVRNLAGDSALSAIREFADGLGLTLKVF